VSDVLDGPDSAYGKRFPHLLPKLLSPRFIGKLHMSLSITPGRKVLTRNGPSSSASACDKVSRAANVAVTVAIPRAGGALPRR
jgi:hypothetical protein